jgi:hypothetical protein
MGLPLGFSYPNCPTGLHLDAREPGLTFHENNPMKLKLYRTGGLSRSAVPVF